MITKLLDDLEMFLDVGVMSLNSSNLQMPREPIYIGHQVHVAICSRWALSANGTGCTGDRAPV